MVEIRWEKWIKSGEKEYHKDVCRIVAERPKSWPHVIVAAKVSRVTRERIESTDVPRESWKNNQVAKK